MTTGQSGERKSRQRLAAHGFTLLRRIGMPDNRVEDATHPGIEKTTRLVRSGAYRTIRRPL